MRLLEAPRLHQIKKAGGSWLVIQLIIVTLQADLKKAENKT